MEFEIVGNIRNVELIAKGSSIKEINRLRRVYGFGKWRKLKGVGAIASENGSTHLVELHWYEATGIGRKEFKIKRFLD